MAEEVVVLERGGNEENGVDRHAHDSVGPGTTPDGWCTHLAFDDTPSWGGSPTGRYVSDYDEPSRA